MARTRRVALDPRQNKYCRIHPADTNGTSQNLENVQYEASNNSADIKSQMQTAWASVSPAKTGCLGIDGGVISGHPQEPHGSVCGAPEHTQTIVTIVYSSTHTKQYSEKNADKKLHGFLTKLQCGHRIHLGHPSIIQNTVIKKTDCDKFLSFSRDKTCFAD